MDIQEIRRKNLRILVEEFGEQRKLAENVKPTAPGHISQMYNGTRSMGSMVARRFEVCLGKPHGWMDMPHEVSEENPEKTICDKAIPVAQAQSQFDLVDRPLFDRIYDTVNAARCSENLDEYSRMLLVTQLYIELKQAPIRVTNEKIQETMNRLEIHYQIKP